jgi:hypothetical protein
VFFGHVLPGSIAGDVAKGVSLALKDEQARAGLAASIVAEKVMGLAALGLFFDIACAVVYMRRTATIAADPAPRGRGARAVAGRRIGAVGRGTLVALRSDLFAVRGRSGMLGRLAEGSRHGRRSSTAQALAAGEGVRHQHGRSTW